MTNHLNPYDTGMRLEPLVWVNYGTTANENPRPAEADDYGRVDFDDDSGCTIATAYIEREANAYVLYIDGHTDTLTVASDTGRVLVLDEDAQAGIGELLNLAERGREDFNYQASRGDYTDEDCAEADRRWTLAQATIEALRAHTVTKH